MKLLEEELARLGLQRHGEAFEAFLFGEPTGDQESEVQGLCKQHPTLQKLVAATAREIVDIFRQKLP